MGADVKRRGDLLAAGLFERESLDPLHAGPVVGGEGGSVHREVLAQVEQLHLSPPRPASPGTPPTSRGPPPPAPPGTPPTSRGRDASSVSHPSPRMRASPATRTAVMAPAFCSTDASSRLGRPISMPCSKRNRRTRPPSVCLVR